MNILNKDACDEGMMNKNCTFVPVVVTAMSVGIMPTNKIASIMKKLLIACLTILFLVGAGNVEAQTVQRLKGPAVDARQTPPRHDTIVSDGDSAAHASDEASFSEAVRKMDTLTDEYAYEDEGIYKILRTKFIEGNAGFMSLVALALVLGLAFCIERIIFLSLSEIDTKKFMSEINSKIVGGDIEGAKTQCGDTRGPVASICYQGLLRINTSISDIERSVQSYGTVQVANLEKGCVWIKLFIAIAPSLGFLGTVIGMVMAFDNIQLAGDINSTIVASGMKVALITTIFGIVVALILQLFYNYIISKIDHITAQMEESAITLLDALTKYKEGNGKEG